MGVQTGRLREREGDARAREQEAAVLSRFSARLVSEITVDEMAEILVEEIRKITSKGGAVFLFGGEEELSEKPEGGGYGGNGEIADSVERVRVRSEALGLPGGAEAREGKGVFLPLETSTGKTGVLYIEGSDGGRRFTAGQATLLAALANLAAAFLERKSLQLKAMEADALREADRLKSTLVSSVSHNLKTPLASVTATVTNLLEKDIEWENAAIREELSAVSRDLVTLNGSISSLVDLARLEADAWEPKRAPCELGEILSCAVSKLPHRQRHRIAFSLPESLPPVCVDFVQWVQVFQHLLDNALKYGGDETPVRVGASSSPGGLQCWVEDAGPGIVPEERERVFEKFYRVPSAPGAPSGTGLGLAITREILRFHGATIRAESAEPRGARFVISLPSDAESAEPHAAPHTEEER